MHTCGDLICPRCCTVSIFIPQAKKLHHGKNWGENLEANDWCRATATEASEGWNEGNVVLNHASRISQCPVKQIRLSWREWRQPIRMTPLPIQIGHKWWSVHANGCQLGKLSHASVKFSMNTSFESTSEAHTHANLQYNLSIVIPEEEKV